MVGLAMTRRITSLLNGERDRREVFWDLCVMDLLMDYDTYANGENNIDFRYADC